MSSANEQIEFRNPAGHPPMYGCGGSLSFEHASVEGFSVELLLIFAQRVKAHALPPDWTWVITCSSGGISARPVHVSGHNAHMHPGSQYSSICQVPGVTFPGAS